MKTRKLIYLTLLLTIGLLITYSCNKDDDCTEQTWYQDADGDGFGNSNQTQQSCTQPTGYVSNNADCDDANVEINPNATETPDDNIDSNCNGNDNT